MSADVRMDQSSSNESQNKQRPNIQIEVVNELQVTKKDNQRSVTKDNPDNNNKKSKSNSNNGNKSKCKAKEPDKISKTAQISQLSQIDGVDAISEEESGAERAEKGRSDKNAICSCGKLLKRVKNILERNDKKDSKDEEEDIVLPVRYYPESLSVLSKATKFTEIEVKRIYRGFKNECPNGVIEEDKFKNIYSQFFPLGASTAQYAHFIFNAIDRDQNGTISFEEFITNLSTLQRGTLDDKLTWMFQLYDINNDGFITKPEMTDVITAVHELMGKVECREESHIKDKVDLLFKKMDHNEDEKISLDEFLASCHRDDGIIRSITVFQTVF